MKLRKLAPRYLFVTGTDTGAGKTILTALLLAQAQAHLSPRKTVAALKPFCSGGRSDAELLFAMQQRGPRPVIARLEEVNPFHYAAPLAPARAAQLERRRVRIEDALAAIESIKADTVLIEGAGGLLAPLGAGFSALDLIEQLEAEVIVAAPNRLGVLNHARLTVEALQHRGLRRIRIALIEPGQPDEAAVYNREDLARLIRPLPVITIGHLQDCRTDPAFLEEAARGMAKSLAQLLPTRVLKSHRRLSPVR